MNAIRRSINNCGWAMVLLLWLTAGVAWTQPPVLTVAQGGTGASTASGARTNLGLEIGTDVQAASANLTTYAGITPAANVQSLLGAADYAAMRALLDLEPGTDVAAQSSLANYLPLTGGTMTGPLEVRGTSGAQITGSYDASNKFTLEATSAGRLNIGASSNEIYFRTNSASIDALSIILGGGSGQTRIYGRAGTTRRLILGNSLAGDIIDMGNYGSNPTLGFYGKSPVAKPASTDDLKDALVNLGLYTSGGATPLDLDGGTLSAGQLALAERSADPSDPAEGQSTIWQSDGTGSGDDGDIMVKITAGGVTKTITLIDFSAF